MRARFARASLHLAIASLAIAAPVPAAFLGSVEEQRDAIGGVDGLDGASAAVVSPDGRSVYVTGHAENALAAFARDRGNGTLAFIEAERNGAGGVAGLVEPVGVGMSHDGRSLYTFGENDAVAVFGRDVTTGELGFVEQQQQGVAGVDGLLDPKALLVSPDDRHLYVAAFQSDAVLLFAREAGTGELDFVANVRDGVGGVDGLFGVSSLATSPDGRHLYTAASGDSAVAVFARDSATGALDFVEAEEDGVGGVDGLGGAISVAVSPDGRHVYAAAIADQALAVFARDPTTGELDFVEAQREGVGGVQGLALAGDVAVAPDGRHVLVLGTGIAVFERDPESGALAFVEVDFGAAGHDELAIAPDGRHVYATDFSTDRVEILATAVLDFVELQRDGIAGADGLNGASDVAVSPDGRHVYATGMQDSALAVFARDRATGALDFVEREADGVGGVDGLAGATSVAPSPDGRHVYATGFTDSAVVTFARDPIGGALTFVEVDEQGVGGVDGTLAATSVAVSPDGDHVYVASFGGAIAAFARDSDTGALAFVNSLHDGVGGVDGLDQARAVVVSPSGAHVYVASLGDSAIAIFDRDAVTGAVSYQGLEIFAGVLGGARSLAFSPNGQYLYVTAVTDSSLAVYLANPTTGVLFFGGAYDSGFSAALDGASAVAVSPSGRHVIVAGNGQSAIGALARSEFGGTLGFVQMERDGEGGVDGLAGPTALAVSPDGRHVYVTGSSDDALAVFAPEPSACALALAALLALAIRSRRVARRGASCCSLQRGRRAAPASASPRPCTMAPPTWTRAQMIAPLRHCGRR